MHSVGLVLRQCSLVLLAMSTLFTVAIHGECTKDCASCSYHMGQQTEINSLACTLECEGKLPSAKAWGMCKELLQLAKVDIAQEAEKEPDTNESHFIAKKYGGFMKRYGGFMKKMDELYHVEPEEDSNGGEIPAKKYGGFMKKEFDGDTSDLLRELLGTSGDPETGNYHENNETPADISKRYGGFMRNYKRSPDQEDETREMQKRYGGFMRRVGRPEWWQDYQKRYGGFMRRFADSLVHSDEDGESYSKETPEMDKRYGGFMRF
ncbi:proenkephalin-A isoform X3 [Pelobates cultripes]|uniref:Proenkephalin-A isoform X3 n=1 Tax=Pelobates cultripes TaxID=61616 RepID=A0AAD1W3F1_PELCU|nr:proenkephalin-A isoform X3 [Pelobates cultripes]